MAMYNEITVTAELTNIEYMITKNYNLLQNKPQINSVELMGNKSLEDLGINPDAEENVIDVVKVNGSALTPDANKAVNVTVTTGSDNGTVKVNGSDVAVKGLKSAAFTEATAYDAAGSAAEVQGNVDALTAVVNGKVDKVQGKGLSQNDFTNAYKTKLDGIEAGAQVNTVTSVAGKTGAVILSKSDVGLGNVDNTSDLNKPISTATQTALNAKADTSVVNAALENKANVNGNYEDLSVGQLLADTYEVEKVPYIFRTSGGALKVGDREYDTLVGGTVAFNQLVDSGTSSVALTTNHKALTKVNGAWSVVNGGTIAVTGGTDMVIDLTQMFGSTIADYIYALEQATAGSGVAYFKSLFPKDYYDYNAGQLMSVKALSHKMVGFNAFNVTTGKAKLLGGNRYQITGTYTALSYSTGETLTPDSNGKFTPSASGELTVTGGDNTTCVHLVWDGERDGEYEAYSEHIYPLDSDLELRGIPKLDANNNLYYDGDTYESDGTVTRKYGVVDLGSLTYTYVTTSDRNYFFASISGKAIGDMVCPRYVFGGSSTDGNMTNKADRTIWNDASSTAQSIIKIKDLSYTDKDTFKTAMNGVYLVYELATPTTETADTFENPQLVDNWGTEEYTDSREVQIPVGHITKYPPDLKAKLENLPSIPKAPTTNGTYVLKATVSDGVATYSWISE